MWLVGVVICAGWIFSLCLHEFSHAIVAYWGGDKFDNFRQYSTLIIVGLFWYAPWFSNFAFKIIRLITSDFLHIPDIFINTGSSLLRQPINQFITLAILLIFGWSLNSQKKLPIQKGNNSVKKNAATTNRSHSSTRKTSTKTGGSAVKEKVTFSTQVQPETRKRAIAFAGYDKKRIERLLNSARLKNPNRSEQWYWEKIIYDMERDRGF